MKNLTLLFLLIPYFVFSQQKHFHGPPPPTSEDIRLMEKRNQCFNSHRYNAQQRRAFYPFNSAITIKLISFTVNDMPYRPLAVNDFAIDSTKVKESKTLSNDGIDSLTDILYNVGFTPIKKKLELVIDDPGRACYNPRNAVLFIDATGKVTQYIEFCFECHRYYLSSRKIKYTVNCENKYELLKSYFLSQGIQYGTILPKGEE